jgi:splicing factor 3B subunit 3
LGRPNDPLSYSYLYQFQKLGDDDDEDEFSSANYPSFGMSDPSLPLPPAYFRPRPLENLILADELESLDPIVDGKVLNVPGAGSGAPGGGPIGAGETPQFYTACGRGPRSTFRMMRHGLEVEESVSSDLPGIPNAVWTTKLKEDGTSVSVCWLDILTRPSLIDQYDTYIILSFVNGTLVLSIGETIEEVSDTGILSSSPTLSIQQLGSDALLQVHPHGIRHIMADRRVNEWKVPPGKTIVASATNRRQVVVALSSAELVYFELDLEGTLNEYQDWKAMGSTIVALSIAEVPTDRQRTPYLVRSKLYLLDVQC